MAKRSSSKKSNLKSQISEPQMLRVLIVEDSEDDALFLIRRLKEGGYHPVFKRVATADAMNKAVKEKQWDIILCDYMMPDFDAPAAIAVLRELNIDIPFIIISGNIGEKAEIEFMRLGAHDCLNRSDLSRLCPAIARELKEAKIRKMQKHTEETFLREEQRFRALAEQSSDIIALVNQEGTILYENRAVERILDLDPKEMIGKKIFDNIHPDDLKSVIDTFNVLLDDKDVTINFKKEVRLRHRDGSWRTFELAGNNLVNNNVIEAVIVNLRDIAERKQAEDVLRESERKYKLITEKMTDIVWIADMDLRTLYITPSVRTVLGFSREELPKTVEKQITPASLAVAREILARELAIEKNGDEDPDRTVSIVSEVYHKDGSTRWLETIISGLRDDRGVLTRIHGVSRDITERKRMEDALRASEEKFASAFKYSPGAMCISTIREGRFVDINEIFLNILGYKRDEIVGRSSAEINLWANAAERDTMVKELTATGKVANCELCLHDKQGNIHWGLASMSLVKIGGESHILTQTMDITERKRVEEELQQSEERYRTILDEMDEGYEETDLDGNYAFVNDAFLRVFGYRRDEIIGTNFRRYTADKRSVKELSDAYGEMYKTGIPIKRNLEWDIIRKDGVRRTCEFYASLRKDANGFPIGFRGTGRDITDRKKSKEALRKSEESYTKLVNAIPDVIVRTDLAGEILFVNDNTLKIGGYSLEEMQGQNLLKFISPENHEDVMKDLLLMRKSKLGPKEYNLIMKDGTEIPFEVNADFLLDEKRKPFAAVYVCRDISERKRVEKLLKEKDERFKNIARHLPGIIYQFYAKDSGEYGINYISAPKTEAAKIISNIDAMKLDTVFPGIVAHIHEDDRDRFLTSIKTAVEKILPWNFEGRMVHSGMVIWIQGLSVPKRYKDQTVFDGILLNISERKQAEAKSRQSEEKFHKIFMTTPNCIAITRMKDGSIIDVNNGFEDIVGWKRGDVIGTKSAEPPLNFWADVSELEFMVAELRAGRDILHRQFEFRRSDDSVRTGIYSARTIHIEGEESLIFILQDITEQKRMELELAESHKMRLVNQIASGVAHEVRNPLHAIQAISEAMAMDLDEKSDYKDYLMHIKAQVERLSHLMNDLLDLGKPIQSSQFSRTLLAETVAAALRSWKEAHPGLSQKVKVVNNLRPDDIVLIDSNKIQQVIINLMENAAQHSPQNEEILLELGKVSQKYLMVKVIDKGTGLKPQDHLKIFEPFYTTRKSGTGLGLSLCKHIVESHGGTIGIFNNESAPGCTARFILPIKERSINETHSIID
ncbi:MAG: PAS domain S-box protein [Deltaproteobacteria bacterium]|nr:PAS domain S-box protein [Deltaproteobacteria bacterium]